MSTDDLIRALSQDTAGKPPPVQQSLAVALVCGLAVSAIAFMVFLAPRPDIAAAAQTPRFLFKFVVTLALALGAVGLVLRLARPGAATAGWRIAVWIGPVLLALAVLYELFAVPEAQWSQRLIGTNSRICLTSIPLLSAPLLAGALLALRRGAPTRPMLAGAVAGLVAGGLGATLYASHCTDDSPLFVATWYTIAIAGVTAVGALAGWRVLRW